MTTELKARGGFVSRAFVLEDIHVRDDGDGRTVEAYAAVFNKRAEIRDWDGHYYEELSPGSFTKTIKDNGSRFGVFYNHGMTIHGTPAGDLSVPIGVPQRVAQDGTGVLTVTRYLDNPLADSVLDAIKQKAVRGQSFSGKFMRSELIEPKRKGDLPTIVRQEVAMREYGPTVFPAYVEAKILGTRTVASFLDEIAALGDEDRDQLRQMLGLATPLEPDEPAGTPTGAAPADEREPAASHSTRHEFNRLRARARREGGPLS